VPKAFWQFAWLFNSKKEAPAPVRKAEEAEGGEEPRLAKIKEEPYEGEEGSGEPLFQLSLCGHLLAKVRKETGKEELEKMFYANKVEYKDFINNPLEIINDNKLVVRIDNSLYTWQLGAAILACKFAFGKDPGDQLINSIIEAKSKKSWYQIFGRDNLAKLDIEEKDAPLPLSSRVEETEIVRYRKTPDSGMLSRLGLRMGENRAKFSLEIGAGVFEETEFRIYLWDENEQIVVSDIDGTITRSDVMGQLKTNYIHKGVCLLYNEIYARGYKMLYMTARAIGQYAQTRRFLEHECDESKPCPTQTAASCPPGPSSCPPTATSSPSRARSSRRPPTSSRSSCWPPSTKSSLIPRSPSWPASATGKPTPSLTSASRSLPTASFVSTRRASLPTSTTSFSPPATSRSSNTSPSISPSTPNPRALNLATRPSAPRKTTTTESTS
jgi:hypothetical protein